ncbi:TPA: acyl-CoA synthetase [bacterium]|nr:acyl-CoA synthetase [bacterium]
MKLSVKTDLLTIPEALKSLAEENRRGFSFLCEDGREYFFSFAEIYERSRQRASALKERGFVKGDRIALILPESEDFIFTFYGAILAGIIPVPLYPPLRPGITAYLETIRHIIQVSQANAIITVPPIKHLVLAGIGVKEIITSKELDKIKDSFHNSSLMNHSSLDDVALLQFTSGSIAFPKGVMITHRNIASNVNCFMEEGIEVEEGDIGVSWLPLYHDMGLIGCVVGPTYYNMPMVFMSPLMFIKRPREWLLLITRHKATVSFAPNFAYGFSAARIKDTNGLDLGSWRIAGCGSEPISYETLKGFGRYFKASGFREDSFLTAYGMAESTLAITFSKPGEGIVAERVDLESLYKEGLAIPSTLQEDLDSQVKKSCIIVSCGKPFRSTELLITGEDGKELPEHWVGEIVVRSPSVMKGYYNNEEGSKNTIKNGWLYTGDLGYTARGNLYVCGRKKDLIIIRGRNYYPQDIEWAANEVEGVRRGNAVVFGLRNPNSLTESIAIVTESHLWEKREKEIKEGIRNNILNRFGLRVERIEVLPPGSLPKTSSGKLQRNKTRELFEAGRLVKRRHPFLEGLKELIYKTGYRMISKS